MDKTIQQISTFFILLPIIVGLIGYVKAGKFFRLFLIFLVYGLITDVLVGFILKPEFLSYAIFKSYSLLEAMFIFWFIFNMSKSDLVKKISRFFLFVTIPIWILLNYVLIDSKQLSNLFDPYYEIGAAFLTGFSILKLVEEHEDLKKSPLFWFLLGIFIYCFCTFFITGFLNSDLLEKIWFIHDSVTILVYIIFSMGFLSIVNSDVKTDS